MYMNNKFKYNPSLNIRYPDIRVNYDDSIANTFFSYVISGDVDNLNKYIIDNSVPISIRKDSDGKNALHLAVESSLPIKTKLNMIKYLLTNNIPIDEKDSHGNTALLIASQKNDKDIINELLSYKADPSIGNNF